jgi:hypothetical protein
LTTPKRFAKLNKECIESNITGKNNGLIDEEPKLMYIYRQGLPGR